MKYPKHSKGWTEAGEIRFPARHSGLNPKKIVLRAEKAGGDGLYQEIAVSAFIGKNCIADIVIGVNDKGEFRVLSTVGGDGDCGDKVVALFPQRPVATVVEINGF